MKQSEALFRPASPLGAPDARVCPKARPAARERRELQPCDVCVGGSHMGDRGGPLPRPCPSIIGKLDTLLLPGAISPGAACAPEMHGSEGQALPLASAPHA